ncbi:BatA domain-containing protein [Telluribacter sp.]|jgi:hypothetical protein|uniref:BatA domain-containing protein n=1 Tax=Telluribacter sp. TaxID=1978767 RepID=UPI002E0D402F|nr:BatA domain-containing protein [Telluribacter sp.]
MEFLKPIMLWGALAVIIPILIHFWHQKKGKVIAWATTQWLLDKNQQQHRGLRLDNLLLLALRCLLLLVLSMLLSRPVMDFFQSDATRQNVHLVQADDYLTRNFRFELEEAARQGEKIYWISAAPEEASDILQPPGSGTFTPIQLQSSINQLERRGVLGPESELHLYLLNQQQLADVPFVQVPTPFQLHAVADSTRRPVQRYMVLPNNQKLYVNATNELTRTDKLPAGQRFHPEPILPEKITVLVAYQDKTQQQTVAAALAALMEVYGLKLVLEKEDEPGKAFDLVFTDKVPEKPISSTYYVVSNGGKQFDNENSAQSAYFNVHVWDEVLTPRSSEMVASGQLPERLGELLVKHFGLKENARSLSRQELNSLFIQEDSTGNSPESGPDTLKKGLLLLFILLIGTERYLALQKNA